jgi:O-antigen ligase
LTARTSPLAANGTGASGPVLFWAAATLLVLAPVYRGGNRAMALLVLEVVGLLALAALAWWRSQGAAHSPLPATLRWGLAILAATPLVHLVPIPMGWWAALPGHAPYAQALEAAGLADGWRSITINARATEYAALALIPPLAVFLAVRELGRRDLRKLAAVFVVVAVGEAVLGILQVGAGRDSILYLGNPHGGGAATGTYVNRNHFAALMAMALPMLVAYWAAETLPTLDADGRRLREHPRHADQRLARRLFWSLLIVLVMAALFFARSRAGIGCGLAAFAAASLALVWGPGPLAIRATLGVVAALALLLAAYVGLTPVLERFAPDEVSMGYEGRLRLAAAALRGAFDFLPLGSGLGTFVDVYTRYQSEGLLGYIDHAHNDYAEAFLEMGVLGVAVVALLALSYFARWAVVTARRQSRGLGFLQVSAGLGVLAMAIHGAFDFNFHIPANAIYFAFLAGVFFYDPPA